MKNSSCVNHTVRWWTLCLAVGLLLLQGTPTWAQRRDRSEFLRTSPTLLAAFQEVVAKPSQCIVLVECDGKQVALGTVVDADGWILTKASQLEGKVSCKLRDGQTLEARVMGVEEPHDLALLKVETRGLPAVAWQSSKSAEPGDWVASAGQDKEPVAIGVVSVAARKVSTRNVRPAPRANSGFLGVSMDPTAEGAVIREVQPRTGASRAGLKEDDVILAVDGKAVDSSEALIGLLQKYKPDDVITLKIKRDDKEMELKATLGKRPASRGDIQNNMGSELSQHRTGFPNILQHDTVIKPTDCGGPLVNLDGKVVGINIARAGRTESYAIPTDIVLVLLPDLKSGKLAPKKISSAVEEKIKKAQAAVEQAEKAQTEADKALATLTEAFKEAEKAANKNKDEASQEALQQAEKARDLAQKKKADADAKVKEARAALAKAQAEKEKGSDDKD